MKSVNSEEQQTHGIVKGVEIHMGAWTGKADFIVIDMDDHQAVLGMDFLEKHNSALIPYREVMVISGKDGRALCEKPLVQQEESTSKLLGAIEFIKGSKLIYGEKLIGPRTYIKVIRKCRTQCEVRH